MRSLLGQDDFSLTFASLRWIFTCQLSKLLCGGFKLIARSVALDLEPEPAYQTGSACRREYLAILASCRPHIARRIRLLSLSKLSC